MTKQTKKLTAQTTVTTVTTAQKFPMTDANGNVTLITLANLKAALLGGLNLNALTDGVFIMTHRCKTYNDDFPLAIRPEFWVSGYQNQGEVADGVLLIEGGHALVIAPTEAPTKLNWASGNFLAGGTVAADREDAIADWEGKANTAAQIAVSTGEAVVTNTASYAPGFCNLYSRENANGVGLTAGKWWLPSIGEMLMIYANMNKINYALSLIEGATLLQRDTYWTSTENSATYAWRLTLNNGGMTSYTKATETHRVRPVSAFIH